MAREKIYLVGEPPATLRRKRGLYCLLTGLTIIFIILYATPTNLELKAMVRKWRAMESIWERIDSLSRSESTEFTNGPENNEADFIVTQTSEVWQSTSDSVAGDSSSEAKDEKIRSTNAEKHPVANSMIRGVEMDRVSTIMVAESSRKTLNSKSRVTSSKDSRIFTESFRETYSTKKKPRSKENPNSSSPENQLRKVSTNRVSSLLKSIYPKISQKTAIHVMSSPRKANSMIFPIDSSTTVRSDRASANKLVSKTTESDTAFPNADLGFEFDTFPPTVPPDYYDIEVRQDPETSQNNANPPINSNTAVTSDRSSVNKLASKTNESDTDFPNADLDFEFGTFQPTVPPDYYDIGVREDPETPQNNANSLGEPSKYLVNSESCKIPDFDPFHPRVQKFIEYKEPIDCSDYPPITYSEGNELRLNYTLAHSMGYGNFTCCYRALYRDKDGQTDDSFRLDEVCKIVNEITYITDEFLKVECKADNGTIVYENYHSFISEKPNVEKRCNGSSAKYSVLLLGVDNMSRLNMHRQLNRTFAYIHNTLDAVEMYGFNKVGDNTFPNVIAGMTGYNESELSQVCWNSDEKPLDKCDFIWKAFAKKGYRTLLSEDTPYIATFNYVKVGFFNQPTDYYFRPFILAYEDALGHKKKLNCHICVGSVSETEAVLHWTKEFALKFKNKPYFAFSWINSLTHDYLNSGSSADHLYLNFFKTLHDSGALENTVVIFLSDHGMRWGKIRSTYIGRLEERLPMLFLLLPKNFRHEYPTEVRNLIGNSHRLVTPFDIHATLDHLLHIDDNWRSVDTSNVPPELKTVFAERAQSLLMPVSKDRSCEHAHIREHWCTCGSFLSADPESRNVREIALYIVYVMNKILQADDAPCSQLVLHSIKQSRVLPASTGTHTNEEQPRNIYTVILQTSPGDGTFEGTVQFDDDDDPELLGEISRLNLYGNQSECIDDATLKKYCYCE